jgi:uncharacterized protein YggE
VRGSVNPVNRRFPIVLAALMLALLLPATVGAAVERTVSVHGTATQKVPNDTASLGFSVSKERKTRKAALQAVAADLRAVIAAVQSTPGIGSGDISTGEISVRKTTKGKQTIYRASEGIGVILHEPNRAGELVNTAVAAGATGTRGPNFFPGNPELAFNNALLAAFAQAKSKATALATSAGATLGQVLSIEEGTEVSGAPLEAAGKGTTAAPSPPVKPGNSTVTATVRVVFALQ